MFSYVSLMFWAELLNKNKDMKVKSLYGKKLQIFFLYKNCFLCYNFTDKVPSYLIQCPSL